MLKFLPNMLLNIAQKFTHYVQYYAYIILSVFTNFKCALSEFIQA